METPIMAPTGVDWLVDVAFSGALVLCRTVPVGELPLLTPVPGGWIVALAPLTGFRSDDDELALAEVELDDGVAWDDSGTGIEDVADVVDKGCEDADADATEVSGVEVEVGPGPVSVDVDAGPAVSVDVDADPVRVEVTNPFSVPAGVPVEPPSLTMMTISSTVVVMWTGGLRLWVVWVGVGKVIVMASKFSGGGPSTSPRRRHGLIIE